MRFAASVFVAFLVGAQTSDACSCLAPAQCELPLEFPLIFTGKVIAKKIRQLPQVDPSTPPAPGAPSTVTFAVSEYLNGQAGPEVNINTSEGCCACGYLFTEGLEYVVFASQHEGAWFTSTCSPTRPLTTAVALLEQLRAAKAKVAPAQVYGFAGRALQNFANDSRWNVEPVGNVRVRAIGTNQTFEVMTSPAGAFTFSSLPADTYRIEPAPPAGLTTAEAALRLPVRGLEITAGTRGCEANIRLLNDSELSGVLVDGLGRPVRGMVRALTTDESIPEPARMVDAHETAADGHFRFRLLPAGKYRIAVWPYRDGKFDSSRTIFYPGVVSIQEALTFDVKIGQHVDSLRFVLPE